MILRQTLAREMRDLPSMRCREFAYLLFLGERRVVVRRTGSGGGHGGGLRSWVLGVGVIEGVYKWNIGSLWIRRGVQVLGGKVSRAAGVKGGGQELGARLRREVGLYNVVLGLGTLLVMGPESHASTSLSIDCLIPDGRSELVKLFPMPYRCRSCSRGVLVISGAGGISDAISVFILC